MSNRTVVRRRSEPRDGVTSSVCYNRWILEEGGGGMKGPRLVPLIGVGLSFTCGISSGVTQELVRAILLSYYS